MAGVAPKYHQTNSGSNRTQLRETASVEHLHSMPLARELANNLTSKEDLKNDERIVFQVPPALWATGGLEAPLPKNSSQNPSSL